MEISILLILINIIFSLSKEEKEIEELEKIKLQMENYIPKCHVKGNNLILIKYNKEKNEFYNITKHYGIDDSDKVAYAIGSNSKSFTGLSIRILEYEGKLNITDKIDQHLNVNDYFKKGDSLKQAHETTIFQLLTHSSGLITDTKNDNEFTFPNTVNEYSYSNAGYGLLGKIVENVSGMKYRAFIKKKIFDVLEMKSSEVGRKSAKQNANVKLIPCFQIEFGNQVKLTGEDYESDFQIPAGGIVLSTKDMIEYLKLYLRGEKGDLSKELIKPMISENKHFKEGKSYGYGIESINITNSENKVVTAYFHSGSVPGYLSVFAVIPELNIAGAYFSNQNDILFSQNYFITENFPKILAGFKEEMKDYYILYIVLFDILSFILLAGGLFLIGYKIFKIIKVIKKKEEKKEESKIKHIIFIILKIIGHLIFPSILLFIALKFLIFYGLEFSFVYPYCPSLFIDCFVFIPLYYIGGLIRLVYFIYTKIKNRIKSKEIKDEIDDKMMNDLEPM